MHIIQLYGRVCRVCMCKRNNMHNLNEISEEYRLRFEEMLQKTMHQQEGTIQFPVPQEICDSCMDQLQIAYRFQEMFLATNEQLHKIWEESHKAIEPTDEETEVDVEMRHSVQRCDDDLDPIKLENDETADAESKIRLGSNNQSNNDNREIIVGIEGSDGTLRHIGGCHKDIEEAEKTQCANENDDDDDYEDEENVPLSSLRKNDHPLNEDLIMREFAEECEGRKEDAKNSPDNIPNPMECNICNKRFKYAHHLTKHQCKPISTLSQNRCEICSKDFSSANMLQKHKRSKHNELKTSRKAKIKTPNESYDIEMKQKPRISSSMNEIKDSDYSLSENDEDEENNEDADYIDNEQEPLKTKQSATSNYPCTECNASFRFEKQLERHIKKHTSAHRFVCIICNDRFKYPFMLQKHVERHHPEESSKPKVTENKKDNLEKSHTCNYCPSAYTNVGGLAQHMSKKHPEIIPFKCDKCDKTFVVEEHLKIHTNRHMGIKNFKCELCDKSFSFKFAMKQHMRIHTGDLNYLCTLCGKKFYRPSNLRQHMQRHGDEKNYSCPHCPKRFKCPSDRYIHLMSHQEGKNHVCSTCGARFSRVDTLHQHQVLHTGQKPYKCDQCPMAFPRLMNLNRHLRTHTGEKPYKCNYCDKAYAQSNDLNKHKRTHIGENTYICTQCPAAFKYQADLRNHEWEHYRKQKEEEEQQCKQDVIVNEMEMKPISMIECNK